MENGNDTVVTLCNMLTVFGSFWKKKITKRKRKKEKKAFKSHLPGPNETPTAHTKWKQLLRL
jgi:hypothetical protein